MRGTLVSRSMALLLAFVLGCSSQGTPWRKAQASISSRGYPLADLRISRAGRLLLALEVELARTPEEKSTGLMHVRRLSDEAGMAFVNEAPSRQPFFMKNTLIPLDIAFWDEDGRIVDILQMEPCRADPCQLYEPRALYIGALEVNQGLFQRRGIRPGDLVRLEPRR